MNSIKSALAIVALLFFISCDEQPKPQISNADRQYFNDVRVIIHSLEASFEHIKALTAHADAANPRWIEALVKDADDLDTIAARLTHLQPPGSLTDYNQRLLAVASELRHAAESLRASIKYFESGNTKAAVAQIQQTGTAMVAIRQIVTELTDRTHKLETGTAIAP